MRTRIHSNGLAISESIARFIDDRLLAAVGRHESRLDRVEVHLRDLNGPRGGEDMQCDLFAHLRGAGVIVVKEHTADLYSAISLAAGRLKNAVGRRAKFPRGKRRRRRRPVERPSARFVPAACARRVEEQHHESR